MASPSSTDGVPGGANASAKQRTSPSSAEKLGEDHADWSDHRFLICDRDGKFSPQFKRTLKDAEIDVILTPKRAPNCNAYAERFVLSIKSECVERMIFFGERSLRRAIAEYLEHYHVERAHQGIGNRHLSAALMGEGNVECQERLGGILKHYFRAA